MLENLRKRVLAKRLWKRRIITIPPETSTCELDDLRQLKFKFNSLVKRLSVVNVASLLRVVENGLEDRCVSVAAVDFRSSEGDLVSFVCRLWRWPQLGSSQSPLRPAPDCAAIKDKHRIGICINPFHYAIDIDDQESSYRDSVPWCRLVYREFRQHIGRALPVTTPATRVFGNSRDGLSGLCLSFVQPPTKNKTLFRVRGFIGKGIVIARADRSTWLYNCSVRPVFVSSPIFGLVLRQTVQPGGHRCTGDAGGSAPGRGVGGRQGESCRKVPAGCCLRIFDRLVVDRLMDWDDDYNDVQQSNVQTISKDNDCEQLQGKRNIESHFEKTRHRNKQTDKEKDIYPNSRTPSQLNCGDPRQLEANPRREVTPLVAPLQRDFYTEGPRCYDSVLVSFGKGWGVGYSRKSVTYCPCWLEILFDR